jgi:predicted kinase
MPLLAIVSGLPAAGKSSLARRLSSDLSLPLISRDRLRPALDPLTETTPDDEYWRAGRSLDHVINHFADRLLDVGIGAVIDSNFNWPEQMQAVRDLVARRQPDCFEVCLWADPSVLRARFISRNDPPLTAELAPHFERAVTRPRLPVLDLPATIVEFNTTSFAPLEAGYSDLLEDMKQRAARR